MKEYRVRAGHCDHRAGDDEILAVLRRITAPLNRSWERLERARQIVIKANMVWPPKDIQYFAGRRRELVDDAVMRAVLRLLRERTQADLIVTDTTYQPRSPGPGADVNFIPMLDEFRARYIESSEPPLAAYEVPGGGRMFQRYLLSGCLKEADAVVSIAKMKTHAFMGVTLCLKNLFGLCPLPPHGRVRTYYHHIIRLPYVLPDLGLIAQPCLNVIDALTGQSAREWGGDGRVCNALIAGDHVIATDACGTWLMGHDPAADWPAAPFKRDRNPLRVAAEKGFGAVDLNDIDFESEVARPLAHFSPDEADSLQTVSSWRRTTCEQALHYQAHRSEMIDRYRGGYIFLQDGEVVWHGPDPSDLGSRRILSGDRKDSALWLKFVDPDEWEGEYFHVYADNLDDLSLQGGVNREAGACC